LAFNYSLDQRSAYNPQAPLPTLGPAVFFVLGLAMAVWHWRQWRYRLLLVWALVTIIFAGALLVEPPSSHRLVIVAPALSLLAAVALVRFGEKAVAITWPGDDDGRQTAVSRPSLLAGLLAVAVLFTATDIAFYFGRYRLQHSFADRNTEIADAMAGYLNTLDGQWTAYFYGPPSMYVSFPTIPFLVTDFQAGVNLFDVPEAGAELPPADTPNRVFIFLPERANERTAVEEAYPGGQIRSLSGFYANPLFYAYEVPQSGAAVKGKAGPVLPASVD
jgi:hypothetical protein